MWGDDASYQTVAMTSYTPSFDAGDLSVPSDGAYNVYDQSSSSRTYDSALGDSAAEVLTGTLLSESGNFNLDLPSDNPHLLFKKTSSDEYCIYYP